MDESVERERHRIDTAAGQRICLYVKRRPTAGDDCQRVVIVQAGDQRVTLEPDEALALGNMITNLGLETVD